MHPLHCTCSLCLLALTSLQPAFAESTRSDPHILITKRFENARNNLSPQTGTSAYTFDQRTIEALPQGTDTSFNKVLERAPGVARDSFGQIRVRGEHANLQYRLNGILLPEAIGGFGQVIDSRNIERATLLTGALPAQYGYRTAGVMEIHTKHGFVNGGQGSFQVGSNGTFQPSVEYGGMYNNLDYYFSASHLSSDLGIEAPTPDRVTHNHTEQDKQFGYLAYVINPMQRIDFIFGSSVNRFEIPNNPGQTENFTLAGTPSFDSINLNERQRENNHYAIAAWQGSRGPVDVQIAPYIRYSEVHFYPDAVGDLIFNGVASDVKRNNLATGLQLDSSWQVNAEHKLRSGLSFQHENTLTDNSSLVFPTIGGVQSSTTPFTIIDNNKNSGQLYGVYLQDEWSLTDRLTVNYGARFDVVDSHLTESQLSPRLGVVYKATGKTTFHAGYARYFTPPPLELLASSSIDKFTNTTNEAPNTQNDPVKSERSHNIDAGFTHQLTDEMQIGVDGYYKLVDNLLDEGQFGQALVFTPFNYQRGRIYGLEFTASFTTPKLKAYGNFAWSHAKGTKITSAQFNFDPDELAFINDHFVHLDHDQTYTASVGASYQVLPGTTLGIDGIIGGGLRKGFANGEHLPWYYQFDGSITQELDLIPNQKTALRFSLINMLDKKYQIRDGSGIGVGAPQWGPRRAFYLSLSQSF